MYYKLKTLTELEKEFGPDWKRMGPTWGDPMQLNCGKIFYIEKWRYTPRFEFATLPIRNRLELNFDKRWFVCCTDYQEFFHAL